MNKIWNFLKKNGLMLVAFIASVLVTLLFLDDKKKDKAASDAEEEANKAKRVAEKEEADRIAAAKREAELQRQVDDENARKVRIEAEKQIDKRVEDNVKKDLENTDQLAEDFASVFGGTNVKSGEK